MPEYTTYADLETIIAKSQRSVTLLEKSLSNKSLFLSHSSKDRALLPGVLSILEKHGASVYVDVLDDELPSPSPEMSQRLKDAVNSCRRFVLFVTPNSKRSIWIPWELGLADGTKGLSNVALFPASPTALEAEWSEREYLGLYRRIVWGPLQGESRPLWLVWDHTKTQHLSYLPGARIEGPAPRRLAWCGTRVNDAACAYCAASSTKVELTARPRGP